MRWKGREQSGNIEDRRGISGRKMATGGTIGTLAIVVIVWLLGGNPTEIINSLQSNGSGIETVDSTVIVAEEELSEFAAVVLKDTEDIWNMLFEQEGKSYREPTLVLFSSSAELACGFSSSATGPFYCPGDEKVYIDLSFCDQLKTQFGAYGDFAVAYVIAHEIGHHVQNQLGILGKTGRLKPGSGKAKANQLSVRIELQADFLAGMWAHYAEQMLKTLDAGDIDEAMNAAAAVGDDRLQKKYQGRVVPDAFTHGTSAQRKEWFRRGWETGDLKKGDTFKADI